MTDEAPEPSPIRPQIPKAFTIGVWVIAVVVSVVLFFVVRIDQKLVRVDTSRNQAFSDSMQIIVAQGDSARSHEKRWYKMDSTRQAIIIDSLQIENLQLKTADSQVQKKYQEDLKIVRSKPISIDDSLNIHLWLK